VVEHVGFAKDLLLLFFLETYRFRF